jgi:hypothetical protein
MRHLLDPLCLLITAFVLFCAIHIWAKPPLDGWYPASWWTAGERLSGEIDPGRVEVIP